MWGACQLPEIAAGKGKPACHGPLPHSPFIHKARPPCEIKFLVPVLLCSRIDSVHSLSPALLPTRRFRLAGIQLVAPGDEEFVPLFPAEAGGVGWRRVMDRKDQHPAQSARRVKDLNAQPRRRIKP